MSDPVSVPMALFGAPMVNTFIRAIVHPCKLPECGRWCRGEYCCDRCWLANGGRHNPATYLELLARSHQRGCNEEQRIIWGEDPGRHTPRAYAFTARWRGCSTGGRGEWCNRPRRTGSLYCCDSCAVLPDNTTEVRHTPACTANYEAVVTRETELLDGLAEA